MKCAVVCPQLTATVAYRYLQTSTDVALSSGDPTVAAPGYLYAGGEQVKPTNPPTTFDELQERMEALDELANMTDQESSYRRRQYQARYLNKSFSCFLFLWTDCLELH